MTCIGARLCPEGQRLLAAETAAGAAWVRLLGWSVRSDGERAKRALDDATARLKSHRTECSLTRDDGYEEIERQALGNL